MMRWLIAVGVLLLVAACGPTTYSWDAAPRLPRGGDHSSFRAVPGSAIEVVTPVGEIVDDANDTGGDTATDAGQDVAGDEDVGKDDDDKDVGMDDDGKDVGMDDDGKDAGKDDDDKDAGKDDEGKDVGKDDDDKAAGKGEEEDGKDTGSGTVAEVCGGYRLVNHTDMDAEAWDAYLAGWAGHVEQSPPNPHGAPAFDVMCKLDGSGAPRFLKAYGDGYVEWFNAAAR